MQTYLERYGLEVMVMGNAIYRAVPGIDRNDIFREYLLGDFEDTSGLDMDINNHPSGYAFVSEDDRNYLEVSTGVTNDIYHSSLGVGFSKSMLFNNNTVCYWFKFGGIFTSFTNIRLIYIQENYSSYQNRIYPYMITGGKIVLTLSINGDWYYMNFTGNYNDAGWHFFSYRSDNTAGLITATIDDESKTQAFTPVLVTEADYYEITFDRNTYFSAGYDSYTHYNRVLSAAEINILRNGGVTWKRIRNLRHYTGSAWVRDRAMRYVGAAPAYQQWTGYPDSPVLTSDYPYQVIGIRDGSSTRLIVSDKPWWADAGDGTQRDFWYDADTVRDDYGHNTKRYDLSGGAWSLGYTGANVYYFAYIQSNCDVYAQPAHTSVLYFANAPLPWKRVNL